MCAVKLLSDLTTACAEGVLSCDDIVCSVHQSARSMCAVKAFSYQTSMCEQVSIFHMKVRQMSTHVSILRKRLRQMSMDVSILHKMMMMVCIILTIMKSENLRHRPSRTTGSLEEMKALVAGA